MKSSSDSIIAFKGSIQLAGQYIINTVMALVFFIFLARLVSKAEMGVYAALIFSYMLFQTVGTLGLNVAAAHFVPKFFAEDKHKIASGAAKSIIFFSFSSSLLLGLAYFFLSPFLSFTLTKTYEYANLFRLTSLVVFFVSLSVVMDGLMQGVREFSRLALIRMLSQMIRIFISIILLFAGYGLYAVIIGYIVFGSCISFLALPTLLKKISLRENFYSFRPIWSYSSPILGSKLLELISGQIDIFLLMLFANPVEVGGYNVALTASSFLVALIFMSVYSTLLPTMSRSFGKGGIAAVEKAFEKASRYMALAYFPTCIGLISLSTPTIWLIAGKIYQEAIIPLSILASSNMVYGMAILIMITITSVGMTRRIFEINLISILGGAISLFLLIPILGIIGAAIGRGLLSAIMLIYGIHVIRRSMSVRFDSVAIWKSLLSSIFMGLLIIALQAFHTSVILLPFYIIAGGLSYAISLKALKTINKDDLGILREIVPEKLAFLRSFLNRLFA